MRSKVLFLSISALTLVLIVIGILGLINTDSSSNTDYGFENSSIEVPSEWENLGSPDKKVLLYGYNSTYYLTIEFINKSTYYGATQNVENIQNNNNEFGKTTIEGVEVTYEKHIVYNTIDDFDTIKSFHEYYIFQKETKFYVVRLDFISNGTDLDIINSSSALFNETLKSIIRTI